jgi:hypothetical protein
MLGTDFPDVITTPFGRIQSPTGTRDTGFPALTSFFTSSSLSFSLRLLVLTVCRLLSYYLAVLCSNDCLPVNIRGCTKALRSRLLVEHLDATRPRRGRTRHAASPRYPMRRTHRRPISVASLYGSTTAHNNWIVSRCSEREFHSAAATQKGWGPFRLEPLTYAPQSGHRPAPYGLDQESPATWLLYPQHEEYSST